MNDFESVLSTALRAEAEEISMNVDMQKAADSIDVRIDRAERRKRRQSWMVVAAAAVVIVAIVLGARLFTGRGVAQPVSPKPTPSPMTVTTSTMTPNFTIALPGWTRDVPLEGVESDTGQAGWSQKDCSQLPTRLCPVGEDLRVRFFSVRAMYRPQDGPTVTSDPTYAQYVAYIASLPAAGAATVSPPTLSRSVDDRRRSSRSRPSSTNPVRSPASTPSRRARTASRGSCRGARTGSSWSTRVWACHLPSSRSA